MIGDKYTIYCVLRGAYGRDNAIWAVWIGDLHS